jgi:transposase
MRTIELGVTINDAAVDEKQTTIFCSPVARDPRCPDCGREGRYRDTVIRPLTDLRLPAIGKRAMTTLIESIRRGAPAGLEEIAQLGRTLWRRRTDILAFFDHHASNGPTEAINGRLEALHRNALGFRNFTHYRWHSLLHSGALHSLLNAL